MPSMTQEYDKFDAFVLILLGLWNPCYMKFITKTTLITIIILWSLIISIWCLYIT